MTEVKSKKDRLVENPMGNPTQSLKALIRHVSGSVVVRKWMLDQRSR